MPELPVRRGQMVTLDVTGLNQDGLGVGRYEGFTLFVAGALPGERVTARIIEARRNFGRAALLSVHTPSPRRAKPPCAVFGQCGGCQLQHLNYAAQLEAKTQLVRDVLARIGGLSTVSVLPALGMSNPWHYRNKAQFPVGMAGGRLMAGLYAAGSHQVIETNNCPIQHPMANLVQTEAVRLARASGLSAYDEFTHTGLLRHILVRVNAAGEALLVFVTSGRSLPRGRELALELMERVPAVRSVWQNINPKRTNVVLGRETVHLAGAAFLSETIMGLKFRVSPHSFLQVNPQQTEVLYGKVLDYLAPVSRALESRPIIDVYCGIGTVALTVLAAGAAKVYGIESVPEAVADAQANAALNGFTRQEAEFIAGPAEEVLPRLHSIGVSPAAIVFDPPRKGCAPAVLQAAVAMRPERMVYVSCNPATLARDLGWLAGRGYRAVEVQPVDMFPQTGHVECCVLLVESQ